MFLILLAATPTFARCTVTLPDNANSWKGYCAVFDTEAVQIAFPGDATQTDSSTTVTISQDDAGVTFTLVGNYPVSTTSDTNAFFEQEREAASTGDNVLTYNLNQGAPSGSLATLFTTKNTSTNVWTQYYIRVTPKNIYRVTISYNPANYSAFQIGTFALFRSIFTVS